MPPIPRDKSLDSTTALLSEGYAFISNRCRRYRSDIFQTRLMLTRAICMMGAEAAEEFYRPGRFTRRKAMPRQTLWLLQDKGSVQALDGEDHRWRKQMFMSLMSPPAIRKLCDRMAEHWRNRLRAWQETDGIVLHSEVQAILCHAVCDWAGIPIDGKEVPRRTREFGAMIEAAGAAGPRNWYALLLRRRSERWIRQIVEDVRAGRLPAAEGTALHRIAWHRDLHGDLLAADSAVVEIINILRPTVAVARFVTFCAMALHEHPECRQRLKGNDDEYLELFVQEVRRFYPFFPLIAGRVLEPFEWRGHRFGKGDWVILDLYGTDHDPRTWSDPGQFRPERFRTWNGSAYNFVPQGGGDHYDDHRCPGEWITIELMKRATRILAQEMAYRVPEQDLGLDLSRMPTLPRSGFRITDVREVSGRPNGRS